MLNCSDGYVNVAGYATTDCRGNPTVEASLKHSECIELGTASTGKGEWAHIDCSAGGLIVAPNFLLLSGVVVFAACIVSAKRRR
tara:strand:- start:116 stop:367 length:252 start_codon:yes stop_codon:yes gene_type:complete